MCRNIVPTLNSTSKQKWCYVDYCIHFCFRHPVLYDAYTEMLLTYTEIFVLGTFDSAEISHHRNLHPHSQNHRGNGENWMGKVYVCMGICVIQLLNMAGKNNKFPNIKQLMTWVILKVVVLASHSALQRCKSNCSQ